MVTLEGTVSAGALLAIATTVALAAGLFSDTVQLLDPLLPKLEAPHDIDVSCAGTTAERVNCAVPL
jgi:hypothetical protein